MLPRVLMAVHAWARRPWYARAWLTWPLAWQVGSVAALLLIVAATAMVLPVVRAAVASLAPSVGAPLDDVVAFARQAELTTSAAFVIWRLLVAPVAAYALGLLVLLCLVCAAFATAVNHLAFGKA